MFSEIIFRNLKDEDSQKKICVFVFHQNIFAPPQFSENFSPPLNQPFELKIQNKQKCIIEKRYERRRRKKRKEKENKRKNKK